MLLKDKIRDLRKSQGLTQVELAELLGIRQQVIASYESGLRKPPIDRLPALAKALNVPLEELLSNGQVKIKNPRPKVNQNKRTAKIQELLEKLSIQEQRFFLKQIELSAKQKK